LPRIKYRNGEILLMSPLPRHGREANILADVVKALLDRENRNYEAFTPITMEIPESGGIEPDYARMLRPFRGFRLSPQACDRLVVDVLIKQILANRYGYLN
jgi:Uma2 family endonuclease